MILKERFEEASKKLPVQTCLDGKLEILYHGFKFVKDGDNYDILDLKKGEYHLSILENKSLTSLFKRETFIYACNVHFIDSSSKKLLKMEMTYDKNKNDDLFIKIKNLKHRIKKCISSL